MTTFSRREADNVLFSLIVKTFGIYASKLKYYFDAYADLTVILSAAWQQFSVIAFLFCNSFFECKYMDFIDCICLLVTPLLSMLIFVLF